MKRLLTIAIALTCCLCLAGQTGELPRSTPARQGVNPAVLNALFDSLKAIPTAQVHHVMVLRHDTVIGELHSQPFAAGDLHTMYSASKTVTALAVGMAIDDGLLSVDDKVSKYLRDKMPATLSPALESLTVRHLLTMTAGHVPNMALFDVDGDWLTAWFNEAFNNPGEQFAYDSMGSHALATIVCRVTGKSLFEYVNERLFTPMHITVADWERGPDGVEVGAWGLRLQAESQAKLGLLLLHGGNWQGQQLVSEQWIHDMTQRHVSTRLEPEPTLTLWQRAVQWVQHLWHTVRSWFTGVNVDDYYEGYGYQTKSILQPLAESFFAAGYGGQLIYVTPRCDLVVVINGMARSYGDELKLVYDMLVTSLVESDGDAALPDDAVTPVNVVALPQGVATSPFNNKAIVLDDNTLGIKHIALHQTGDSTLDVSIDTWRLHAGHSAWIRNQHDQQPIYSISARGRFTGTARPFTTAAAYAWTADSCLDLRLQWVDGGDCRHLLLDFEVDSVIVRYNDNHDPALSGIIKGVIQ